MCVYWADFHNKVAELCQDVDLGPLEAALLNVMRREREDDNSTATEGIVG